jgi:molybdate transport system regulatory protein
MLAPQIIDGRPPQDLISSLRAFKGFIPPEAGILHAAVTGGRQKHRKLKAGLFMAVKESPFRIRSKIWVEDANGKVVFGLGRYRILEAVQRLGSLQAAAQELKMSYRAIWARVSATEERLGKPLLIRDPRGSRLTPLGETLLKQFHRLLKLVESESDGVYDDLMAVYLDS